MQVAFFLLFFFPLSLQQIIYEREYPHKSNNFCAYKGLGPNNSCDKMEARCNLLLSENLKNILINAANSY